MENKLRVWWKPQIPMKSFYVEVETPKEAKKLLDILANYDLFQLENRIKPDYCNAGGLEIFNGLEWEEWYDDCGDDIDQTEIL
jgi:hypothetical protein